jgi:hypothetical protein
MGCQRRASRQLNLALAEVLDAVAKFGGALLRQKPPKPRLLEMMIRRERVFDPATLHEKDADGVAQRPLFVVTLAQEIQSLSVKRLVNPDHLNLFVVLQVSDESQRGMRGAPRALDKATNSAKT